MSNQSDDNTQKVDFIQTRPYLTSMLKNWWMVVLIMLFGAVGGQVVHWLSPDIYEASAKLTTSIDFSKAGILSDVEMDVAMVSIGDVIKSDAVLDQLQDRVTSKYPELTQTDLRQNISLERYNMVWTIRFRNTDPVLARHVVNQWAEIALDQLSQSHAHAVNAEQYYRYLDSLTACLSQAAGSNVLPVQCPQGSFSSIQNEIAHVGSQTVLEGELSQGVNPAATVVLTNSAQIPETPVNYGQAGKIFSGALIGLAAALILNILFNTSAVRNNKDYGG